MIHGWFSKAQFQRTGSYNIYRTASGREVEVTEIKHDDSPSLFGDAVYVGPVTEWVRLEKAFYLPVNEGPDLRVGKVIGGRYKIIGVLSGDKDVSVYELEGNNTMEKEASLNDAMDVLSGISPPDDMAEAFAGPKPQILVDADATFDECMKEIDKTFLQEGAVVVRRVIYRLALQNAQLTAHVGNTK